MRRAFNPAGRNFSTLGREAGKKNNTFDSRNFGVPIGSRKTVPPLGGQVDLELREGALKPSNVLGDRVGLLRRRERSKGVSQSPGAFQTHWDFPLTQLAGEDGACWLICPEGPRAGAGERVTRPMMGPEVSGHPRAGTKQCFLCIWRLMGVGES